MNFRENRVFLLKRGTTNKTNNNNNKTNNIEDTFFGKLGQLQNSALHSLSKIQPISTTGLKGNSLK